MLLDLRPLLIAPFRRLAVATWINEFGEWIGDIALALLVYDRTGSPLATAAMFLALRFVPAVIAQPLTSWAAPMAPRRVLPAMYTAEAAIFAVIAVVATHFSLPLVLVLCAADGILAVTTTALARSATAHHLLDTGMLREGNGILNLGIVVSGALGPALGGLLVDVSGASTALLLDVASFLVAAAVIGSTRGLQFDTDDGVHSTRERLAAGQRALRDRRRLRRLMVAVALVLMLGSIVIPIEVVFVKHTLHGTDAGYGELLGAWGVGMTIGGLLFMAASRVRMITILGASTVLVILGYAGMAVSPTLLIACLFSALGGIGNGAGGIAIVTAIQEATPAGLQSQVMGVFEGINQAMPAFGFIIGGVLTALSSPRAAYALSAVGVALVVLCLALSPIGDTEVVARTPKRLQNPADYTVEETV